MWDTYTQDGYITKFLDEDIKSTVLEIGGCNVSTTYMICPKGKQVLGITMPFLVMIVKNVKKYFSFEITILDDTGTRRRFRVSNFQSTTQILPLCTVMPIALADGWNQIQFNMSDFCRRAYQKQFVEVQKCKINANIRIRRIYFADRIFAEDEMPAEYKLFIPLKNRGAKNKAKTDEEVVAPEKVTTKTASQSQVQEEKRSSKILEKPASVIAVTESAPDQTMATKEPVATGDEPVTADGETVAAAEGGPDQSDAATTEPDATAEEPVAEAEALAVEAVPDATAEESVAEAEAPAAEAVPDATAEEPVAEAEAPAAEAVPDATAEEPVAEAEAPAAEAVPDATAEEPVAEAEAPAAEAVPDATAEEPVAEAEAPAAEVVPDATAEEPATEAVTETTEPVKESVETATQYDPESVEDKGTDAAEVTERTESAGHLETIMEKA